MTDQPHVSDHALVRYLERVKGFDMEVFRKEILTEDRINAINAGAKKLKIGGIHFIVRNKVIITVMKSRRQW